MVAVGAICGFEFLRAAGGETFHTRQLESAEGGLRRV